MARPPKRRPVRVLSLAAGEGYDLKNIRRFYPEGKVEYHHVDLHPTKAQMCVSPDREVSVVPHIGRTDEHIKDRSKAPDNFFDRVHLNMQTSGPYLLGSEERLRNLNRILRPGGRLFVTEQAPGIKESLDRVRAKSGGRNVFMMGEIEHPYGLRKRPESELRRVRRFNSRLARKLRNSGFDIERAQLIPRWKLGLEEHPEGYELPPGIGAKPGEKLQTGNPKELLNSLTGYSRLVNQLLVLRKRGKS